jgi:hypothetical protein
VKVLTAREASMFACLTDTVVAPAPYLPAVSDTDAAAAFDDWLARAPRANAIAMRAMVVAAELAPLATGHGHRLRRLPPPRRKAFLHTLEHSKAPPLRQLTKAIKSMAYLCYYGDDGILNRLGYDPDANVRRGRELRKAQGRP